MAAPSHDLTTSQTDSTLAAGGTFNLTHNGYATPRTNRFVLVLTLCYAFNDAGATERDASGVTYGGVAMTSAGAFQYAGTTTDRGIRAHLWYLVAPAEGSVTVATTVTAGEESEPTITYCSTFYDVDQGTPFDGYVTAGATGAGPATCTVVSAVGDLVVAWGACGQTQTLTVTTSGATEIGTAGGVSILFNGDSERLAAITVAGGASIVPSWTLGAASNWVAVGVNLNAISAAGAAIAWVTA